MVKKKKKKVSKDKKKIASKKVPIKKKKRKVKTTGKKNIRLRNLDDKPAWKHAMDADKLPKTGKADTFQNFAIAAAGVNKDLVIHKGKNGFSIHHPKSDGIFMGVGGSVTTLRLTSELFNPDKDKGCKRDIKGYPTVVIENPTEDEVRHFAALLAKRAKI